MDEDFHDKNLVKKSSLYEYNVLDDHKGPAGSNQPSIEFVPIENAGTRKATREGKKLLSKGAEAAKTQTNTVQAKDINAVSNARKRVSKKKLKLGGGLLGSQGFRGSTATRSDHQAEYFVLVTLSQKGLPCFHVSKHISQEALLQRLPKRGPESNISN